ncbi:MAG: hypothetical protein M1510_09680 [Nitrospirae bacterium]|nr:hypothetical protein [Nitrospirota bacterium]
MKIAAVLMAIVLCVASSYADDPKQMGKDLGAAATDKYGNKDGLKTNLVNPIISNNTPLSTLDGSKSFNAQLVCPSSKKFLEVFIQPGASGDITTIIANEDTNMDGTSDYAYQAPFPVSGVCANGVISCGIGTWSNCNYYKWVADESYRVTLQDAGGIVNVGGCYCVNNSCGSNLVWNNLSMVLKDLGGGVAGAVSAKNAKFTISNVQIDGTSIIYYGQDSGNCSTVTSAYGSSSPDKYYSNFAALNADVSNQVISQSGDPNSYYNLLTAASYNTQSQRDVKQCSMNRVVNVSTIKKSKTAETQITCSAGNNACSTCQQEVFSALGFAVEGYIATEMIVAGQQLVTWWNNGCGAGDPFATGCGPHSTWIAGNYLDYYVCQTGGTMKVTVFAEHKDDVLNEAIDNKCQALESDPKCKLKEETVDSVMTYRNFNPTSVTPLASCQTFSGEVQSFNVCRDWWQKSRTYMCDKGVGYDFTDAQKRLQTITTTTRDNTSSFYYSDLRQDSSGNWITESTNTLLPERDMYGDCEIICKVKVAGTDTQASIAGNTSQYRQDAQCGTFFYKTCTNGACPVGPGEQIVKDCQCINEFAEAAAIIQSMRMAGRDQVCSSGVAKPLQ